MLIICKLCRDIFDGELMCFYKKKEWKTLQGDGAPKGSFKARVLVTIDGVNI